MVRSACTALRQGMLTVPLVGMLYFLAVVCTSAIPVMIMGPLLTPNRSLLHVLPLCLGDRDARPARSRTIVRISVTACIHGTDAWPGLQLRARDGEYRGLTTHPQSEGVRGCSAA